MNTASIGTNFQGIVAYIRKRNFPMHKALFELIDNSVDAGATQILIVQEDGGHLAIIDNGHGFEDLTAAFTIGHSDKDDKIGRYGIGMKDACIRFSNATEVISRGQRLVVPWKAIAGGFETGLDMPVDDYEDDGRTILRLIGFDQINHEVFRFTEIRHTYHPLIVDGALTIYYNGQSLKPLDMPEFVETVDEVLHYQGKRARIIGGTYAPNAAGKSNWNGYNPYYKGRLIGGGKIQMAGVGTTGCTNFMFMLHLEDAEESWELATNKDAVHDLAAFLDGPVFDLTKPLLERAADQALDIATREVEDQVNAMLSGSSGNITRAKKQRETEKKESSPGRPKRNTNTANDDGEYYQLGGKPTRRIRFRYEALGNESVGEIVCQGRAGYIVKANTDNAFIAANKTPIVALFFAKMAYAIHRSLDNNTEDFTHVHFIMDEAGKELEFSAKAQPVEL